MKTTINNEDGFFGIPIDEDASLEFVSELAEAIARHGEAFALYYANKRCYSADISSDVSAFKGAYQGEYEDEEDFAQSLIEDLGMLDNRLMCYFDYKALSRDLFNTDYIRYELYNGSIAVFRVM